MSSSTYRLLEWSCMGKYGRVMTVFFDAVECDAPLPTWKPPTASWTHVDHGLHDTFEAALDAVKASLIGHGMVGNTYRLATLPVDGGVKIWVVHDGEAAA